MDVSTLEPAGGAFNVRNSIQHLSASIQNLTSMVQMLGDSCVNQNKQLAEAIKQINKWNERHDAILKELRQLQAAIPERHQAPSPDTALRFNS